MYSYVVGKVTFSWKGVKLNTGDALTGEDARELELPANDSRRHRCMRVLESVITAPSASAPVAIADPVLPPEVPPAQADAVASIVPSTEN